MSRRIVAAPDSFKGTHTASQVAGALAAGARAAGADAVAMPIADGGEGTMDALLSRLTGERRTETVSDPLGRPVEATWAMLDDGATAIVEMAQASGLGLVGQEERDAYAASTRGTGELIAAAARAGATRVLVAVGGSATSDGGAGAVEVLQGCGDVPEITVICDVTTPFEDAPKVFGPQKGADPATVRRLEERLDAFAERAPRDPRGVPMSGCAGGLSGGLWAYFGAELVRGAPYVLDAVGFDEVAGGATLVLTGEGALDEQTFAGKAVGEVARRSGALGVQCHAVVGRSKLTAERAAELGVAGVTEASTLAEIEEAGRRLAGD